MGITGGTGIQIESEAVPKSKTHNGWHLTGQLLSLKSRR